MMNWKIGAFLVITALFTFDVAYAGCSNIKNRNQCKSPGRVEERKDPDFPERVILKCCTDTKNGPVPGQDECNGGICPQKFEGADADEGDQE